MPRAASRAQVYAPKNAHENNKPQPAHHSCTPCKHASLQHVNTCAMAGTAAPSMHPHYPHTCLCTAPHNPPNFECTPSTLAP